MLGHQLCRVWDPLRTAALKGLCIAFSTRSVFCVIFRLTGSQYSCEDFFLVNGSRHVLRTFTKVIGSLLSIYLFFFLLSFFFRLLSLFLSRPFPLPLHPFSVASSLLILFPSTSPSCCPCQTILLSLSYLSSSTPFSRFFSSPSPKPFHLPQHALSPPSPPSCSLFPFHSFELQLHSFSFSALTQQWLTHSLSLTCSPSPPSLSTMLP